MTCETLVTSPEGGFSLVAFFLGFEISNQARVRKTSTARRPPARLKVKQDVIIVLLDTV